MIKSSIAEVNEYLSADLPKDLSNPHLHVLCYPNSHEPAAIAVVGALKNVVKRSLGRSQSQILSDYLYLKWLIRSEEYRGQGIGAQLLVQVAEYALENHYSGIFLTAKTGKRVRFFESLGFISLSEQKPGNDIYTPMALALSERKLAKLKKRYPRS